MEDISTILTEIVNRFLVKGGTATTAVERFCLLSEQERNDIIGGIIAKHNSAHQHCDK